jgi:ComF family protein
MLEVKRDCRFSRSSHADHFYASVAAIITSKLYILTARQIEFADFGDSTLFFEHLKRAATILYPPTCVSCEVSIDENAGRPVDKAFAETWCDDCWQRLPESWQRGCPKCGSLTKRPEVFEDRCALCRDLKLLFDSAAALGNYHGLLKELVLRMKRDMHEPLAQQLGCLLGHRLAQHDFFDQADCLVPVPIHRRRRFLRGFHAAQVIAEGVKSTSGIRICSNLIRCVRLTEKQGTLAGKKRFTNVKDAFEISSLVTVKDASVVLVDDVMTSGATLSELADLLKKAGARSVHAAIVARGIGSRPSEK